MSNYRLIPTFFSELDALATAWMHESKGPHMRAFANALYLAFLVVRNGGAGFLHQALRLAVVRFLHLHFLFQVERFAQLLHAVAAPHSRNSGAAVAGGKSLWNRMGSRDRRQHMDTLLRLTCEWFSQIRTLTRLGLIFAGMQTALPVLPTSPLQCVSWAHGAEVVASLFR